MTVVATTTWNSADLIGEFLSHYRRLGVDRVFVMDFDSADGTREVLESADWRSFVTLVPFPGIALLDSSNILLGIARDAAAAGDWCLFCDPDELLVTGSMTIRDAALAAACASADAISIPRFNVTGSSSAARLVDGGASHVTAFTLRIDRRTSRSIAEDVGKDVLDPPWIFTEIAPKTVARLDATIAIGEGDHSAKTASGAATPAPPGVYLLHYPLRAYSAFRDKVELARIGFDENPHLSQDHGWQVRRWIRLADSGKLHDEYLRQFIADQEVERLVDDGTLARDERVLRFQMEGRGA